MAQRVRPSGNVFIKTVVDGNNLGGTCRRLKVSQGGTYVNICTPLTLLFSEIIIYGPKLFFLFKCIKRALKDVYWDTKVV